VESSPRRYATLIAGAVLLAAAGAAAWAQAPQAAGRFVSVTGEVAIVGSDGVRRSAERGGDIREGDTILTGDSGLAQARMSDGGLISIRADSEFKLEQFAYKGREDRNASFVVNILKGGFRTITGLIAQVNRGGYRVSTPAATIGVRGTHFEVVHVLPQIASQQVPAGTYNRVFEGITTVQNPSGNILQVVRDQTAFAALQGGNPVLVPPPPGLFGRPTPVPRAAAPQTEERAQKDVVKGEDRAVKMGRGFKAGEPTRLGERPVLRDALPATPIDTPTTLQRTPITPLEPLPTTTLRTPLEPAPTIIKLDPISPTTAPTLTAPTRLDPVLAPTIPKEPVITTTVPKDPVIAPAPAPVIKEPTTTPLLRSPTTLLPAR
jgi:hypothetical protein